MEKYLSGVRMILTFSLVLQPLVIIEVQAFEHEWGNKAGVQCHSVYGVRVVQVLVQAFIVHTDILLEGRTRGVDRICQQPLAETAALPKSPRSEHAHDTGTVIYQLIVYHQSSRPNFRGNK